MRDKTRKKMFFQASVHYFTRAWIEYRMRAARAALN
jgi:hypothetical protein